MPKGASDGSGREVELSSVFVAAMVRWLERVEGPELPNRVARAAGLALPVEDLIALKWHDRDVVLAMAEQAAAMTGDTQIGRRVGEEMFRMTMQDPASRAYFVSLGSPGAALAGVLEHTVKLGRGRRYRVVSSDESGCVVEGNFDNPQLGVVFFCDLALGFWPMLAMLFGQEGSAIHPICQCRGDPACRFVLRWSQAPAPPTIDTRAAAAELDRRLSTFEEMQRVAEELARATDLASLAESILDGVESITPAPGLLVAIRPGEWHPRIVAARRLPSAAAERLAGQLLDGRYAGAPPVVAQAPLGEFGVVAAVAPDAAGPSPTSTRLLEAFARHAVARIESVLARHAAEQSGQTAAALLKLARSLAAATTEAEVSTCLAHGIPELLGADHSSVLRWDPEQQRLVTVAYVGPEGMSPYCAFAPSQIPCMPDFAGRPTPLVIKRSSAAPYVADAMAIWDEQVSVMVPLVEQGDFQGVVCAGFRREADFHRTTAFRRLQGAADLALTAYTKARLLDRIRHQALHDDLTGLPNRLLLEERVGRSIGEARQKGSRMALLFLDLDRFKNVNDSLGHGFGDTLIQQAADRIAATLSEGDFLARMGGDEFVVVLDDLASAGEAESVAEQILDVLRAPLEIGGHSLYVSASVGVAVYPEDGDDYGELLQRADSSMYAAKRAGRSTVRRRAQVLDLASGQQRLAMEAELHRALEGDELVVFYQPQVRLSDLRVVGVEALARWQHPRLGLLAPGDFLSIAEECGLVPQLDRRVRQLALAQARSWHESMGAITVAVNLGAQTMGRSGLVDEISEDLSRAGVDPALVEVELTEGMVGDEDLVPTVRGLAALGCRVAIDDFGTGASVFARLRRMPLDTLKIDRSLVQVGKARRDSSILGAIVRMAHSLGLAVVAEGVETPAQAARLRREGCDFGQGFLFGRAMPAPEVEAVMCSQLANLDGPGLVRPIQPGSGRTPQPAVRN